MKTLLLILFISISYINANGQAAVEDVVFDLQYFPGGYNVHCRGDLVNIEPTFIGAVPPFNCTWYNDLGAVVAQTANLNAVPVGLGRYVLEITKGNWTADYDVYISEPEQLILTLHTEDHNGYDISEQGGSDGKIYSQIQGGVPPNSFIWSTGSIEESII